MPARSSQAKLAKLPLRHRLPNPPALFVGRMREIDWLGSTLEKAPAALVCGPGGIGKTATVLHGIHQRLASVVSRTVFVAVRPGEPTDQVRHTLVRVLASAAGTEVDLSPHKGDPEAIAGLAIDLAEEANAWVVLDDVHHADQEEMNELLTQLAAYARQSRWIVTSRTNPSLPALAGQVLELQGMADSELAELAQALDESMQSHDVRRAISSAAGSPWLLQQYVKGGPSKLAHGRNLVLGDLNRQEVVEFLRALSLLHAAFPLDVLERFAPKLELTEVEELERRGLLQADRGGYRLHDVVRGFLFPESDERSRQLRRRAADALWRSGEPDALLEAARLLVEIGDGPRSSKLMADHGDELLAHGYAPRLWLIVGEADDPALIHWQLRCAAELGNPTALASVDAPVQPKLEDTFAWANAQYAQGDVSTAQSLAEQVGAEAAGAPRKHAGLMIDAGMLKARCLLHRGQTAEAKEALVRVPIAKNNLQAQKRRAALSLLCSVHLGEHNAQAQAFELSREESLEGMAQEACLDVATALHLLGRREGADEVLDSVLATLRGGRATLFVARRALLLRARILLESGSLDDTAEILATVEPFARGGSLLRPFVLELDATRRLMAGELEGLEPVLITTIRESARVDRRCWRRAKALLDKLGMLRADPPAEGALDVDAPGQVSALRRARFGAFDTAQISSPLISSVQAIVASDLPLAVERAQQAVIEARRRGHLLAAFEASQVLLEALACSCRFQEMATAADDLLHETEEVFARRLSLETTFYTGFARPELVEKMASELNVAPVAARRSRALLGGDPPLDEVDRRVIAALSQEPQMRWGGLAHIGKRPAKGVWHPGWGLDDARKAVWKPDGTVMDLSGRALLWNILSTIAHSEGTATKETLVHKVWNEQDYHPLKHDSRLHVSVRKLRMELEDDPSTPTRLLTTDEGYRFGGPVRWLRSGAA